MNKWGPIQGLWSPRKRGDSESLIPSQNMRLPVLCCHLANWRIQTRRNFAFCQISLVLVETLRRTDRRTDHATVASVTVMPPNSVCSDSVAHHARAFWDAVTDEFPERKSRRQRHFVGVFKPQLHDSSVVRSKCLGVVELESRAVNQTCSEVTCNTAKLQHTRMLQYYTITLQYARILRKAEYVGYVIACARALTAHV